MQLSKITMDAGLNIRKISTISDPKNRKAAKKAKVRN